MRRTGTGLSIVFALAAAAGVARATETDPDSGEVRPDRSEIAPPRAGLDPRLRSGDAEGEPGGEPPPAIDLFPEDALGSAVGWELPREPSPSTLEEQAEAGVDRYIDDRIRRDQLGAGIVDGWYYGMRQAMRSAFHPDVGEVLTDTRHSMDALQWGVAELGRHAAPRQQPMDPGGVAPQTIFSRSREDEHVQDSFDQASPLYAPITWYRVELRVVQTRSGEIAGVRVTRSSGSDSLDRAAIDAVRAGTVSLPPPPPDVIGDRDSIATEWGFEMGDIASRVTGISGMEGPEGTGTQAGVLGRGLIRTSVSLLRVTDAEHPTHEERRARRRAIEADRAPR